MRKTLILASLLVAALPGRGDDLPVLVTPPAASPPGEEPLTGPALPLINIAPPASLPAGAGSLDLNNQPLVLIHNNQPLTTDALLGFVNSQPVFAHDLFRRRNSDDFVDTIGEQIQKIANTSGSLQEFRTRTERLITNELDDLKADLTITSSAESLLNDEDQDRIRVFLAIKQSELISKYGGSVPAADKALAAEGSSVAKEMANLRRHVVVDLYLSRKLAPKVVITRQMVVDDYDRNPARWQSEAKIELFTLTLPVTRFLPTKPATDGTRAPIDNPTPAQVSDAENQALAAANGIVADLHNGHDTAATFAKLVEKNQSDDSLAVTGGRKPDVKRGVLNNVNLENFAFSLPANTTGKPMLIRDANPARSAVVIVRVGDRQEARTIPFAEAQRTIEAELEKDQYTLLRREELARLSGRGAVEAVDRTIGIAVDAAVARYATAK